MRGRCQLNKPQTRSRERKPQPWERSKDHLAFVRQLPCCTCERTPPNEAAHLRNETDGSTARKPSDRFTVPLCGDWYNHLGCHGMQHKMGEGSFWSMYCGDPLDLAAKLWSLSRKYEGEELIERGKYAVEEWRRR